MPATHPCKTACDTRHTVVAVTQSPSGMAGVMPTTLPFVVGRKNRGG